MRLRSLSVQDFGAVRSADVSFEDGLNVFHGPNDLGKSTLASAIRAALLLQHGSSAARPFVPWGSSRKPTVTLTLEVEGRLWRVHKVFGTSSGGKSVLEWSNDGQSWSLQEEGRGVDGHLRELLQWGLAAPGGRGGAHGFPKSFLATVLLGEQALPYRLLESSLEGDAEDTGKTRLIEALQAMATDPVYQDVLVRAQERVDEAFTAKGKRSSRKGSPFERVTTEIKQRRETSEELQAQVAQSDAVVSRLAELAARRDRVQAERADAAKAVERLDAALAQAQVRAQLEAEAQAARAALEEIERNQEEIARLQRELDAANTAVPKAEADVEAAVEAARAAHRELERAGAAATALERGEDPKQRQAAMDRAEARRTLEAETTRLDAEEATLASWKSAFEAREAAVADAAEARRALEVALQARTGAQAKAEAATAAHRRLADALQWSRAERMQLRLESLRERAAAASLAEGEAAAKRAEAAQIEGSLSADFPDADARAALERSWQELQMREAALQGGFRVALQLSTEAQAEIDGRARARVDADATIDAEREVVLSLAELGTVTVRPGDPGAHAALEAARSQWRSHADTLERLGLDSAAALSEAARKREVLLQRQRSLLREAELVEAKAVAPDPEELASLQAELEALQRALDGVDAAMSRSHAGEHGDGLPEAVEAAQAEVSRTATELSAAASAASEAKTQHRLAEQRAEATAASEAAARPEGAEDPRAALEALQAERASLRARAQALEEAHRAESEAAHERAERAKQDQQRAEAALTAAAAHEAQARTALDDARASRTSSQAALNVRREQARSHDSLAAAERVARAQDALVAHPAPDMDLSEETLTRIRGALEEAEEALEDAERAVRQQEGALQQVGGQVVRERAQMAREALEDARRQEAEVTLDYDGWRLLLGTLREVENETGAHLGRALDEELSSRLEALSRGRYRGAALGADLETEGVVTAQGVQALDRFSEGVKEQIATLLRVSVAEHLGTTLLLDDHLAQTDPARAEWFRKLLRESARRIQIVVLTCRPSDYVVEVDDGVHVVDLGETLSRL